ncbi:hypothetical protein ABFB09_08060 [Dehalogenimonas sp. THU2]|uniref:hypothetical protein n=1 Tax=Dehalogenimonas sp. THU2 TaxID=3151121 RepID=UPI0032181476
MEFEKCSRNVPEAPAPAPEGQDQPNWSLSDNSVAASWSLGRHNDVVRLNWGRKWGSKDLVTEINWSAIGAIDVETAADFASRLQEAVKWSKLAMYNFEINYDNTETKNTGAIMKFMAPSKLVIEKYTALRYPQIKINSVTRIGDQVSVQHRPPAPSPKEGYKTRFGQRQKHWNQLSLAKDLYDEAVKIKKDKGNIDTTRAKSGSIHDLSPYEELLYMTGLYFASGQIGLAILYGNAANAVMKLFEPERRDPDLSQFYQEQA